MGKISVQGVGKVNVKPDIAVITFAVETRGKRTSEAVQENNERMKKLMEVVEKFEIDAADRKTRGFGIVPEYEYYTPKKGQKQKPPKIIGYVASNGLNVRVREIDKVSEILGDLTAAGAGEINLGFDIDDPEKHEDNARKLAMKDAKRRAELYATTAGIPLGKMENLTEHVGRNNFLRAAGGKAMVSMSAAMESVPVESGETEISVQIQAEYNIGAGDKHKLHKMPV